MSVWSLGAVCKVLDVAGNRLSDLPRLAELSSLARLTLSSNAFTEVPASVPSLAALRLLLVDDNLLRSVPGSLASLAKLERLSLAGNAITILPAALGQLRCLRSLSVERNLLSGLPAELGACEALEELDASCNRIEAVPPQLGSCARLQSLVLDQNPLPAAGLPAQLLACASLTTLSLHGCAGCSLEALEKLPGWAAFDARQRGKQSKRVAGGVLLGERGLDDGVDHRTTRIVVPNTGTR